MLIDGGVVQGKSWSLVIVLMKTEQSNLEQQEEEVLQVGLCPSCSKTEQVLCWFPGGICPTEISTESGISSIHNWKLTNGL